MTAYDFGSHCVFYHRYHIIWETKYQYWGRHFWARGYFCTTSGNVTDELILSILRHTEKMLVL